MRGTEGWLRVGWQHWVPVAEDEPGVGLGAGFRRSAVFRAVRQVQFSLGFLRRSEVSLKSLSKGKGV